MVSTEQLRPHFDAKDPEYGQPRPFSLMDLWREYTSCYLQGGSHVAREKLFWLTLMNVRAIRQESVGAANTDDIVTRVVKTQEQTLFQNPNYAQGDDLEAYYVTLLKKLKSKWWLAKARKERYTAETEQTIHIWKTAAALLDELDLSNPDLRTQLLQKGFVTTTLPVSVGLKATVPNLDEKQKEVAVLMGPPIISVSPPSIFHRKGQTSFAWISRLIFIPDQETFAVLQNGLFTAYSKKEIVAFLQYQNPEADTISSLNSLELMAYLHVLPELTSTHSLAIIDAIIRDIGYFKSPPPIDKKIKLSESDLTHVVHAILDIFEWEMKNCFADPELLETLHLRFVEWEKALLHNSVGGFAFDYKSFVKEYISFYSDPDKAKNPTRYHRVLLDKLTQVYPSFEIQLNLSKLDCVAGSVAGIGRMASGNLGEISQVYGPLAEAKLARAELYGLNTQEELRVFCATFKIPVTLFHENYERKMCPGCETVTTFIGPCVCPLCHVHDNLGILQSSNDEEHFSDALDTPDTNGHRPYKNYASFIQLLHDDIYEENWPTAA